MSVQRLRTDFRFALLTLFGVLTVLGVLPMAVYRFSRGEWVIGLVDTAIVGGLVTALAYLWRGGSIDRTAAVGCLTVNAGAAVAAFMLGMPGAAWFYPVVLYNFLMMRPRSAIVISLASMAAIALSAPIEPPLMRAVFVMTTIVVGMFAFIFAHRTERHRSQLQRLVTRDTLTCAYNRRAMEQELPIAVEAARRQRMPVSLAVLDIDHFKRINDTHGHEAGDRVLIAFASLVDSITRRGDRLFRYGGEEFVLLLPGSDMAASAALTEALRVRVAAELESGGAPVTVSIGAAELAPGEAPHEWLARADAAMYEAKREGRNRVVVALAPPPQPEPAAARRSALRGR